MKGTIGLIAVLTMISVNALPAQGSTAAEVGGIQEEVGSATVAAMDSVADPAASELERALEQFATSLAVIASQVANDPALRIAAARAAGGLVGVAQVVVDQHAGDLQESLRTVAEWLAEISNPAVVPPDLH